MSFEVSPTESEANPFAAPQVEAYQPEVEELDPASDEAFFARQRKKIASSFRLFGTLLALLAIVFSFGFQYFADEPFAIAVMIGVVFVSLWCFIVAGRVVRGDLSVRLEAYALSLLMTLAVPLLLTATGVNCIYRVHKIPEAPRLDVGPSWSVDLFY